MVERSSEVLGTLVRIVAEDQLSMEKAFAECRRIDEQFSRFRVGSELWDLNQKLGEWVGVSEELYGLMEIGEEMRVESGGAFDLCVGGVLESWGYDKEYSFKLKEEVVAKGGMEFKEGSQVKIEAPIDLGGLGKGYALERMKQILEADCGRFLLDAGGDIYAQGEGWKVAFEHPQNQEEAIGTVMVDGFYLASSSSNRRTWGRGDDARHHLVCLFDKRPAMEMMAVYVQGDSGVRTDAWSTALFVMGYEEARKFLEEKELKAMLISPKGELFRSAGFEGELFLA